MPSLPEKFIAVHDALEAVEIPHAIGGAFAVAYYVEPRSTVDIDVNVFVPVNCWPKIGDALRPLGIDVAVDIAALEREDEAQPRWDRNPVHLFFSHDELHAAMEGKVRRVPFAGSTMPIVSPEHLIVRKAMLDRAKDWLDIEQILAVTNPVDLKEIETWLERMVGKTDPRFGKLEEIKTRLSVKSPNSTAN